MWIEVNEHLINLDHAIAIGYEDGKLRTAARGIAP